MGNAQTTKNIFCAKCQKDTPHIGSVDANGELVFTCSTTGCGRFVKLPADVTPADAETYFASHKKENEGQVSLEAQEAKLLTLMNAATSNKASTDTQTSPDATPAKG